MTTFMGPKLATLGTSHDTEMIDSAMQQTRNLAGAPVRPPAATKWLSPALLYTPMRLMLGSTPTFSSAPRRKVPAPTDAVKSNQTPEGAVQSLHNAVQTYGRPPWCHAGLQTLNGRHT